MKCNILIILNFSAAILASSHKPSSETKNHNAVQIRNNENTRFFWHKHKPKPQPETPVERERSNDLLSIGCKCYFLSSKYTDAGTATSSCLKNNMRLASLPTKLENTLVQKYLTGNLDAYNQGPTRIWISGHKDSCDSKAWTWLGINAPFTYTQWAKNEPNNAAKNENCVELSLPTNTKLEWNDTGCSKKRAFLCEASCPRSIK